MNPTIVMHRLLRIERLARELAELVGDEANHANTADRAERPEKIKQLWNALVGDVNVIDLPRRMSTKQSAARESGGN